MKKLFISLFLINLGALSGLSQRPLPPPAPLIYKAPVKADLKEFTAEDKSFSVIFPGVPKTVKRDLDKAVVTIRSVYRQGSNSVVSVFEFKNDLEDFRERTFELFKSSLQTGSPKMKIEAERDIQFDGMAAKEFDLLEDLKFYKIRILISGNKIYELKNDVTNWHILTKYNKERVTEFENETERFFASFKLFEKRKRETVPIDFLGITNETTYVNTFFGFSLEFPVDWLVDDPFENEDEQNAGLEALKTNQEKLDRALAEAVKREVIVFGVTKKKSVESGGENFLVGVLKLPDERIGSEELLNNTRDFFLKNPKFELAEDVKNIEIKGVKFSTLAFITTIENIKIRQKVYLTIKKGYSVTFTMSYFDESGRKSLEKIFETLKFNLK